MFGPPTTPFGPNSFFLILSAPSVKMLQNFHMSFMSPTSSMCAAGEDREIEMRDGEREKILGFEINT